MESWVPPGGPLSHPICNLLPSDQDDVLDSGIGKNEKKISELLPPVLKRETQRARLEWAGKGNFRIRMIGVGM